MEREYLCGAGHTSTASEEIGKGFWSEGCPVCKGRMILSSPVLTPEWLEQEREMGLHSGFPPCCVESYIKIRDIRERFPDPLGDNWPATPGPGYVRCEECIKNGIVVRVHLCSSDNVECLPLLDRFQRLVGRKHGRDYRSNEVNLSL